MKIYAVPNSSKSNNSQSFGLIVPKRAEEMIKALSPKVDYEQFIHCLSDEYCVDTSFTDSFTKLSIVVGKEGAKRFIETPYISNNLFAMGKNKAQKPLREFVDAVVKASNEK